MPRLSLPGVDLWYEDTGGPGTPVVLLHAASGTTECWVHQLPAFMAAGYRCIAYDRRTWGRSRPTDSGPQPGFAGDDLHALLDALGLDRVHLVGTAAGAIPALDYTLSHPERVISLVAANTIGGVQEGDYLALQHGLRPSQIQDLPVELRELGPSYRGKNPEGAARWLEIDRSSRPYGPIPTQPLRDPITYRRLAGMQAPVMVLSGEADLLSPPALMRLLADHIPGSRFVSLPDAGHAGFWERPHVWNGLVLEFLAQHS